MRRENGIRKGLNRLLVLVLAAAVTMVFSFTGVFAETLATNDDTSNTIYIYAKMVTGQGNDETAYTGTVKNLYMPSPKSNGWVTLGYMTNSGFTVVPSNEYLDTPNETGGYKENIEDITKKLNDPENVSFYKSDRAAVMGAVDSWRLITANGADKGDGEEAYVGYKTLTWHLNGKIHVYKVTFIDNGNETEDTGYYAGTVIPRTLSKDGYAFKGWNTAEDGSGTSYKDENTPIVLNSDLTLYAQWAPKSYTVTYTDGVDDQEIFKDQTESGLKYGGNTPAFGGSLDRDGYVFSGWENEKTGDVVQDPTQLKVTGDVTYVAQWKDDKNKNGKPDDEEQSYTVTYKDGADQSVFKDKTFNNVLTETNTPAFGGSLDRYGYVFSGWENEKTGDIVQDPTQLKVTDDVTYVAQWKDDKNNNNTPDEDEAHFSVIYKDGVEGVAFTEQKITNILTGTQTPAFGDGKNPTWAYHIFIKWNPDVAPTVTKDATYTAQWKDDKNNNGIADDTEAHYTVTYTDGVPNEVVFADQVFNDKLTGELTPDFSGTPTRSGYTFAGWTPEVEKTVTKDITYTATWTKNNTPTTPTTPVTPTPSEEHKVTISPNNGDPDITQTVPDGGKAVEPDDLINDGYKFDGWYTDSTMTQPFDFSQPIKSDVHIYAKWTKTNEPVTPVKPSKKVSGILLPKVIAKGKHTQTLTWTALKNVDGYFIYTNHCDEAEGKIPHPFKKVADYKASKARVYTVKNLKTYNNYKYYVAAYKIKNGKKVVVRNSVTVHSVCGNTSTRSTNVKAVKASKHSVTLKKGKTYKIKAALSKVNKKRAFLDTTHCALLRYLTADSSIATVNYKTGVIKAKKAGKTSVYVLGVNGVRDKVTVTVK